MRIDNVTKFVNEYETKKNTYQAFAGAVKAILEVLLQNNSLKYQISAREKSPESLRKKLSQGNLPLLDSVAEVQDLAACRVLFYLETDIERFTRYIYAEFEVLKRDDRYSTSDYNAVHLIVKLKDTRAGLPEYAQFAGMVCEIQLTTILYHAWSEMSHDTIYKPPSGLPEFDEYAYESLRKRFKSVMEDHIKKASYEFEFISRQFEKIKEGRKVFDLDFLSLVERSDSNNEIYENLRLLAQYVEEFGDKTPKELGIVRLIRTILEKSPTLKYEPIKSAIGELQGYAFLDVAKVCLEILNTLRYQYPDEIFDILVQLSKADDAEIRKQALVVVEHLAQYDFHVLKQAGYLFQKLILDKIEQWTEPKLLDNLDVVLGVGEALLEPSFEGTSWHDYRTVNFTFGALVVTDELREIRAKAIEVLRKVLTLSKDPIAGKRTLQALNESVRTPHHGSNPELDDLILNNSNKVIDIYVATAADQETNGHTLDLIEERMHWLIHRFGAEKLPSVGKLKSLLEANEDYQIFRVLVGYDGRFAPDFDFEKDRAERETKVREFLSKITTETFPLWSRRILTIMESYDEADPGKYQYLHSLLTTLSEEKPSLTLPFLKEYEVTLKPVLLSILSGAWKSPNNNSARETVIQWVSEGKYLPECARVFAWVKEIDDALLQSIFAKAVEIGDVRALNCLIDSIAENYPGYKEGPAFFVKVVQQLANHHNTEWINYIWFRREPIIAALSELEVDVILESLLQLPTVDYHAEYILISIAGKYPLKIIEWFHTRLSIKLNESGPSLAKRYDAIPFELPRLREPLLKHEDQVIPAILKWYRSDEKKNSRRYLLAVSRFLKIMFPTVGTTLERYLISTIEEKGIEAVDDILYILREYQGEGFLWGVCKAIIKKTASNETYSEIKDKLFSALSRIGVVRGEYGLAEAYEKKREDAKTWLDDDSLVVKAFLKEYRAYLEKLAVRARKRADEDLELRKREFEQ